MIVVRLAVLNARQHGLVLIVDALELAHAVVPVQTLVGVIVASVKARILSLDVRNFVFFSSGDTTRGNYYHTQYMQGGEGLSLKTMGSCFGSIFSLVVSRASWRLHRRRMLSC